MLFSIGTEGTSNSGMIQFMINILKVEDQDKYCIEGTLLQGDIFEFTEIFKKMKAYFGGHANASESS